MAACRLPSIKSVTTYKSSNFSMSAAARSREASGAALHARTHARGFCTSSSASTCDARHPPRTTGWLLHRHNRTNTQTPTCDDESHHQAYICMPTLVEVAQELNLAQHSQRELRVKLKHASELLHGNRSSKHTVYARAACNLGGHAVRNKQKAAPLTRQPRMPQSRRASSAGTSRRCQTPRRQA